MLRYGGLFSELRYRCVRNLNGHADRLRLEKRRRHHLVGELEVVWGSVVKLRHEWLLLLELQGGILVMEVLRNLHPVVSSRHRRHSHRLWVSQGRWPQVWEVVAHVGQGRSVQILSVHFSLFSFMMFYNYKDS